MSINKFKVITVVGARPQFIKAAAVSRAMLQFETIQEVIIHTGQHFDANMSEIFFQQLAIPKPQYHLNINSIGHGAMTGRMLEQIENVLLLEKPDIVMVYGDTNSTLAGALAAKKIHVPLVHIEAGLRSFNMEMPEEINRILTDRISDLLFCPTDIAIQNLEREGFRSFDCQIEKVGDVMEDAALFYHPLSIKQSSIIFNLGLINEPFILVTIHRAENTDNIEKLHSIIQSLNLLSKEKNIVFPIHPRTRAKIMNLQISPKVKLIDPVGYLDMVQLLNGCQVVITDSGGLQKEAYFFKKYCITIRDQTEWMELVTNGFNVLSSTNSEDIESKVNSLWNKEFTDTLNLYGGGNASALICKKMLSFLDNGKE